MALIIAQTQTIYNKFLSIRLIPPIYRYCLNDMQTRGRGGGGGGEEESKHHITSCYVHITFCCVHKVNEHKELDWGLALRPHFKGETSMTLDSLRTCHHQTDANKMATQNCSPTRVGKPSKPLLPNPFSHTSDAEQFPKGDSPSVPKAFRNTDRCKLSN